MPPLFLTAIAALSKIWVPLPRVWRKASSSAYAICSIRGKSASSSGYEAFIRSRLTGSSSGSAGSS